MSAPAVVITLPLEGELTVRLDLEHEEERERLRDWLNNGRPLYGDLVARALELAREAKAA